MTRSPRNPKAARPIFFGGAVGGFHGLGASKPALRAARCLLRGRARIASPLLARREDESEWRCGRTGRRRRASAKELLARRGGARPSRGP